MQAVAVVHALHPVPQAEQSPAATKYPSLQLTAVPKAATVQDAA